MPLFNAFRRRRRSSFTPITYDLDSGNTSLAIPTGATGYEAWVLGAGGGGGVAAGPAYGGGGGGGCAYKTGTILSGEWGASITRNVGAAGANETSQLASDGVAGGNSTLTATLGGVAVSMTGNGGARTNNATDAAGGTASGGDTNTSGASGASGVGGAPGIDIGGGLGVGGTPPSTQPSGGRIRVRFT